MALLPTDLADTLNTLVQEGRVIVSETRDRLAVNQLNGREADDVLTKLVSAGWADPEAWDQGGLIPREMIMSTDAGVRVTATRPALPPDVDAVLTHSGFEALLKREPASTLVWVQGLTSVVDTMDVRYAPPAHVGAFAPSKPLPDAERIVRVLGTGGPGKNLGRWLLRDSDTKVTSPAMAPWRRLAIRRLLATFAQEIEPNGKLLFRGPPPTRFANDPTDLPPQQFASVQRTGTWLLKSTGEFENKHGLLAAEIARTSVRDGEASELADLLEPALEGAKIAYQFGVTRQSADTLKALGDLRKAVSDEAAKLSDTTRSLSTAVLAAVLGNLALIAARVTLPAGATFVGPAAIVLTVVLLLHVGATIASGIHYIRIQRELRLNWRKRLYRFLRRDEYERMVNRPAKQAEKGFWIATGFGVASTLGLLVAVIIIVSTPSALSINTSPAIENTAPANRLPPSSTHQAPAQGIDDEAAKSPAKMIPEGR